MRVPRLTASAAALGIAGLLAGCTSSGHPAGAGLSTSAIVVATPSRTSVAPPPTTALPTSAARVVSCRVATDRHSVIAAVRLTNDRTGVTTYTVRVRFTRRGTPAAVGTVGTAVGTFDAMPAKAMRTVPIISARSPRPLTTTSCSVTQVERLG